MLINTVACDTVAWDVRCAKMLLRLQHVRVIVAELELHQQLCLAVCWVPAPAATAADIIVLIWA
jgi:hypothetical protein